MALIHFENIARFVEAGILPVETFSPSVTTFYFDGSDYVFSMEDEIAPLYFKLPRQLGMVGALAELPARVARLARRYFCREANACYSMSQLEKLPFNHSDYVALKEQYHALVISHTGVTRQMDKTEPKAASLKTAVSSGGATTTGAVSYEPAPLQTMGEPPQIFAQPNSESFLSLGDMGDPRTIFDVVATQKFTTDFIQVDASQSTGTVLMRVPYGFESAPSAVLTILGMHKYFKGPLEYYLVVRGAGATGSVRISHVKDITQDTYTLAQLQETNASFVVDLSQVAQNQAFSLVLDYAHISKKVLPVQEVLQGTFDWNPSRPGIVVTVNTPVQNVFNPVNPWIEVSRFYGHLIYTTPITTAISPPSPGNLTVLTALAGASLGSFLNGFSANDPTKLAMMTDGFYGPDPGLDYHLEGAIEGMDLQNGVAQITASCHFDLGGDAVVANNPSNMSFALTRGTGGVYGRLVLLDGRAPYDPSAQLHNNLEQVLSTSVISDKAPAFPFPSLDGSDITTYVATLTSSIRDRLPSAAVITTINPVTNPIKLVSVKNLFANSDGMKIDPSRTKSLDLVTHPIVTKTVVIRVQSGQYSFSLWVVDLPIPDAEKSKFAPDESLANTFLPVRSDATLIFTPITSYTSTPNMLSRNHLTQLPAGARAIKFAIPSGSVLTTAGSNAGLPTVTSDVTSAALRFVLNSLQPGQKAEFVLYSTATGKVAGVVYFSSNFQAMYINSKSGRNYAQWNLEQLSTLIIQSVTIKNESESSQVTDDSAWLNRESSAPSIRTYVQKEFSRQMMAAAMIGGQALGGLFSGISSAVGQYQKQQFDAKQNELNRLASIRQVAMNNDTQLQLATANNLSSMQRAQLSSGTSKDIARLNASNTFGIAKLNSDTSLRAARMNNDTTLATAELGAKNNALTNETNLSIAQGNNAVSAQNSERSLEGQKFSATTGLAATALSSSTNLGAKLLDTFVNAPQERENQLKKIEEQGKQNRETLAYQQQLTAGANPVNNQ